MSRFHARTRISLAPIALCAFQLSASASDGLIGKTAQDPKIDFGSAATISYTPDTAVNGGGGVVTITGIPSTLLFSGPPLLFGAIQNGTFTISFRTKDGKCSVDDNGRSNTNLVITGSVDVSGDGTNDYTGTLLTAQVQDFGCQPAKPATGAPAAFDLALMLTGGVLYTAPLGGNPALYTDGNQAIVQISSETNSFTGSMGVPWTGSAKGLAGDYKLAPPNDCKIEIKSQCSLTGLPGSFRDNCEFKNVPQGSTVNAYFSYTITNKGNDPQKDPIYYFSASDAVDTLVPINTTLQPGQVITQQRTIPYTANYPAGKNYIQLKNNVLATGFGTQRPCAKSDSVDVKIKSGN